tara:strand:+ start:2138 stop:2356 length:219 start_codon:yes stop_codon:yes gene_type:complete
MDLPNRRPCTTILVETEIDNYHCTISYHPETGEPCEVFMTGRGKVGQTMDNVLIELGIAISKELQGKHGRNK